MEAAVKEVKGIKEISPREVVIDLKEEAFIPSDYIEDDRQRLATYRRLNLLGKNSEVEEIKRELVDRFGKLPRQLERLFAIINLRIKALQSGIQSISENEGIIQIDWLAGKRKKLAITGEDKIRIALRGIGQ